MSVPTIVLNLLAAAEKPLSMDEVIAATGLERHNVNNVLTQFARQGVADHAPATYRLTEAGKSFLRARQEKRNRRPNPDAEERARIARRARMGQIVDTALHTQPNSVFALGARP